jgi:pyridoxal phosphate enzyme (YggS family)
MGMSINHNLEIVRESVDRAADRAGRNPSDIALMAVSKTKPVEMIREAYEAGQRLFGENRVAEAAEKFAELPSDAEVHLIGHLQKNKAKQAVGTFDCLQSLDSEALADRLIRYCKESDATLRVLLQLKTADEGGKTGLETEDALVELAGKLREQDGLEVNGLMTIAPFTDDERTVREAFARCRRLQERLVTLYPDQDYSTLSMGMSSDYEWAVMEGSTLLRVGSAIFGSRF